MNPKEKDKIIEKLSKQAAEYIKIILKEYGDYIPEYIEEELSNIKDLKEHITIKDTGTISCLCGHELISKNEYQSKIYMPLLADKILKIVKYLPIFKDEEHKVYDENNVVINDNTFVDYVKHLAKKKASAEEFYEENLLHEVMHFCGSYGGQALEEGLTEYHTRKIAQKYNLKTTGCGYPKEVKIAHELENIFDERAMNLYSFDKIKAKEYIEETYGIEAYNFLQNLTEVIDDEFRNKYYSGTEQFNGLTAPFKKINNYEKLNYTDIYEMIDKYKKGIEKNKNEKEIVKEEKTNPKEEKKKVIDVHKINTTESINENKKIR